MSRSFKKHPFAPLCGTQRAQARDKRTSNRVERRANRVALVRDGDEAAYRPPHTGLDPWSMSYDGTRRYTPYRVVRGRVGGMVFTWSYRDWYRQAKQK